LEPIATNGNGGNGGEPLICAVHEFLGDVSQGKRVGGYDGSEIRSAGEFGSRASCREAGGREKGAGARSVAERCAAEDGLQGGADRLRCAGGASESPSAGTAGAPRPRHGAAPA